MIRAKLLLIIVGLAQQFEVASIRPNKTDSSGADGRRISIEASPGNLTMRNVTLMSAIRFAYNVHDFQISGGPDWRASDRYDIIAKPAAAATEGELRLVLRALLADRFNLALRHQSKETPVYILAVGKNGSKLRPSKGGGNRALQPAPGGIAFQNATMADLEQFLSGMPVIDRPVLDKTGLEGAFDFTLTLFDRELNGDPAAVKGAIAAANPSLYMEALERIGLKFEPQKALLDAIVIENTSKPSEN
jgi:uncharacterized protein (TIGR03435 family)